MWRAWAGPEPRPEQGSAQPRCYRWRRNVSGVKVWGFKGKRLLQKQEKGLQTIRHHMAPAGCRVLSSVARRRRTTKSECVCVCVGPGRSAGRSRSDPADVFRQRSHRAPPSRVPGRWRAVVAPGYLGGSREALPSQTQIRTEISSLTFDLWSFGIFLLKESRYQVGKEGHLCPNPI